MRNSGSWHSCGFHLTQAICPNTTVVQAHPPNALTHPDPPWKRADLLSNLLVLEVPSWIRLSCYLSSGSSGRCACGVSSVLWAARLGLHGLDFLCHIQSNWTNSVVWQGTQPWWGKLQPSGSVAAMRVLTVSDAMFRWALREIITVARRSTFTLTMVFMLWSLWRICRSMLNLQDSNETVKYAVLSGGGTSHCQVYCIPCIAQHIMN